MKKLFAIALVFGLCLAAAPGWPAGLDARKIGQQPIDSWTTYNGDWSGRRFSTLTQITSQNVGGLKLAWSYQLSSAPTSRGDAGGIKATPLVVNGILYISVPDNVFAIDSRTGKELWHYSWMDKGGHLIGNRGLGMLDDTLYFMGADNYVIALDATTGKPKWTRQIADARVNYYSNIAPVIMGNHLLIGVGGDAEDLQGFLLSLDPKTGAQQWRWDTTPKPGEPGFDSWPNAEAASHGGGMTWNTGTFDPALNLIYWGTGNVNPVYNGHGREGKNLWAASIVALNADTGKLVWGHSVSPHDTHDWDNVETPVLVDTVIDGKPRKLLAQAARNGYFTVLDRVTGKYLVATPFVPLNWSMGIDQDGTPIPDPSKEPSTTGSLTISSAANWPPPSYSPRTGLFYVNAAEGMTVYYITDDHAKPSGYAGVTHPAGTASKRYTKAIDIKTGKIRWQHEGIGSGGILSTASGLVFTGGDGGLVALKDDDGSAVARFKQATVGNGPISVMQDGRQWIFVGGGNTMYAYTLAR